MVRTTNIQSLTEFTRNAKSYVQQVRDDHSAMAITVNGSAQVVVQDADAYQRMADELEHIRFIKAIRESEASLKAGKVVGFEEAMAQIKGDLDV